jgi:NDP-sugar pyrophosphorylase family protein
MKQNERRTAFILAAGLGTRLKELTSDKPKALVELNKQPLLKVVIENLISQKFNHFVINVHHYADKIVDFIESVKYENVEFEISDERDFLYNTGGAIIKALPYFKESKAVLIHNVDIVSDIDFQSIYDDFVKSNDAAWLLTQERNNKRKIVFDDNNNFVGRLNLETKEYDGEIPLSDRFKLLSFSGLHIIKPEYFNKFELRAYYVFELYKEIAKKAIVKSVPIESNYWFDLGTQEQLKEASSWISSQK